MKKPTLIIIYAYQGVNDVIFANLKNKELESASITEYYVQGVIKRVSDFLGLNILLCQEVREFRSRPLGLETSLAKRIVSSVPLSM